MKKLLTTILCLVLTSCIVLAGAGCGNSVFNGNYVEVQASTVTAFNESVSPTQKGLDVNQGVKFEFIENEFDGNDYEKETVEFETVIVGGELKMAGTTSEYEKEGNREVTESCEIYYDGDKMYINDGTNKVSFVATVKTHFIRAITRLEEFNFDTVVAKYSNLQGVKYFMEERADQTKIKLEFEDLEDATERTTGKILFTYNAQKMLVAINVEIVEEDLEPGDNEYEETIINIEAFGGMIQLPDDLATYTSTIKLPW